MMLTYIYLIFHCIMITRGKVQNCFVIVEVKEESCKVYRSSGQTAMALYHHNYKGFMHHYCLALCSDCMLGAY